MRSVVLSKTVISVAMLIGLVAGPAFAVNIETVRVGNPGNAADYDYEGDGRYGAVGYVYHMGKYEVTNSQYCEFLNAKAVTDTYGLYNTEMSGNAMGGGINRSGSPGSYRYTLKAGCENKPVTFVCWHDTIRFTNWLQNGQGSGSTETGTYTITGGGRDSGTVTVPNAATRAAWTVKHWVLPSENEWYKAAYYKGGSTNAGYWLYPTASNAEPHSDNPASLAYPTNSANVYRSDGVANGYDDGLAVTGKPASQMDVTQNYLTDVGAYTRSASAYGTFDQAGNVWEWNEGLSPSSNRHMVRGTAWGYDSSKSAASYRLYSNSTCGEGGPPDEGAIVGFRVACVPEPATMAILALGGIGMLVKRRGPGRSKRGRT